MPEQTTDTSKEDKPFLHRLAQYYSDFLATDFKKGNLPKRRFQTKDKKGRRTGIPIEKFPSLLPRLHKAFEKEFGNGPSISVKLKEHEANLPPIIVSSIAACIKSLDFQSLAEKNFSSLERFKLDVHKKDCDLEIECAKFTGQLRRNIGLEIGIKIISYLQPTFERSASNLVDTLVSVEEEIAELFIAEIEEGLPAALAVYIGESSDDRLKELILEAFSEEHGKALLAGFFEGFSAGDLFTELRELSSIEKLEDNLEFYLYLGDIKYKSNQFPLFYMPFKLVMEGTKFLLQFEPRVLVNKKGIDYISRIIQEETKTSSASVIDQRILYINPDQSLTNLLDGVIQKVLRAFQFDGALTFTISKLSVKNASVTMSNSLSFALFDKADESMLTDYEELLDQLDHGGSSLYGFLDNLIGKFLGENPKNIINDVLDEWENMNSPDRLVFDTPIPLAEEQRKILSALNNPDGKFITVEGPPGTGKSHTISAIAFGSILKGQSILVLSDKKEALDVVENKLNETLAKVRPSDDFINPILRLGRSGSNFTKLTTTRSVDNLRTQHREIRKHRDARVHKYNQAVEELKNNITERNAQSQGIDIEDILTREAEVSEFKSEYSDLPNFIDVFEADETDYSEELDCIANLLELRATCSGLSSNFLEICEHFGDDAESLAWCIEFINTCRSEAQKTRLFDDAPLIDFEKLEVIKIKILELKNAKGFLGYLFSGNKIKQVKTDLDQLLGFKIRASNGNEIVVEVSKLLSTGEKFYARLMEKFEDELELIPEALKLELDSSLNAKTISSLTKLQSTINEDIFPFLGDEETILEILTDPESAEADFYEKFQRLRFELAETKELFEFKNYNFLSRKTEIETYNALELATEIDARVIHFADNYKNDARTLSQVIRQKKKFPRDKFDILKSAFPCMICSLRDYAEYIPLEKELFDIVIIDEASQVSIAQAFPAIIRAKKMIVLGDRKQFGNVKTSNASKELNSSYFARVKDALKEERGIIDSELEVKTDTLNISCSILDFLETLSNFSITLKKHFRGYPEMISFSSKYFYNNSLQAMKIRGKPIDEVLEFIQLQSDGKFDLHKNTNDLEAETILERVLTQIDEGDNRSVAVITPFTEQQIYISKKFADHERYQEVIEKLKFRSFTFDSCQGEERDIIYFSFVATPEKDKLWTVLPKSLQKQDEEEIDRNKRMQRLNVAFSRGKEKLVFVHSKPVGELSAGKEVLQHYASVLAKAKTLPTEDMVDQNSPAEKKVLNWIKASPVFMEYQPEITPQFPIGEYLKSLDSTYNHPAYCVDFLLQFNINGRNKVIILEYDGFEYHFENKDQIDGGNWQYYLTSKDVEREHVLESYGYKMLRINKFNVGSDPIQTLSDRIYTLLGELDSNGEALIKTVLEDTANAYEGLKTGTVRHCKKCDQNKPTLEFQDRDTKSGFRRYCLGCSAPKPKKRSKGKTLRSSSNSTKKCPNCKKSFPLSEFVDTTNKSGRRSLCGRCKAISNQNRSDNYKSYMRGTGRW